METDRPEEDAYGRVTNPERYQVVADAAVALISKLVQAFDVVKTSGSSLLIFPPGESHPRKRFVSCPERERR